MGVEVIRRWKLVDYIWEYCKDFGQSDLQKGKRG